MKYLNIGSIICFWLLACFSIAEFPTLNIYDEEIQEIDTSLAGQYKNLSDSSLLWGPYRSGLYFGVRPRIPRSLLSGLMWFNIDDFNGLRSMRHFYEQGDLMKKANWVYYDPRFGGRQVINDKQSHINLVIDFIKSEDGKSWGVKLRAKPHKGHENIKTCFVWYSALESDVTEIDILGHEKMSGLLSLDMERDPDSAYSEPIRLGGASEDLGLFSITINDGPSTNKHPKPQAKGRDIDSSLTHHVSLRIPNDQIWQAKDIFVTLLQDSLQQLAEERKQEQIPPFQSFTLRDLNKFDGNTHFIQKVYEGECEFDIIFENAMTPNHDKITTENFKSKLEIVLNKFHNKFSEKFSLKAPFDTEEYQPFAKEIVSGLLGGISYFYGNHLVDRETEFDDEGFEKFELMGKFEGPHELFTLVPSRPFFPRGFLWDEGFHLLPLLDYDSDLALEIIQSWFNLIDEDGWIAREQILGPESRARVPTDFQTQSPHIVNPPTLMLVFTYLLNNLQKDIDSPKVVEDYGSFTKDNLGDIVLNNPEVLTNYTKSIYPKLKSHYEMFRRTQKGFLEDLGRSSDLEAYRWRGRTVTHCLASGLDDYPRPLPPDIAELNVDLLSWIGVMTRSIKLIALVLDNEDDYQYYDTIENQIVENLNSIHWSEENGLYCDVSANEDDEEVHVCFEGYVSLFPFITKMMRSDDYERLEKIVDAISNPEGLWSDYGIRSISKSDPTYKTGEDYWRSPIWININYLVLDSLKHYYDDASVSIPESLKTKLATTYHDLRLNLVNNIFKEWKRTGFVWEQYDDMTGEAKGAKNFLGWTSSVVLMMKLPENL